MEDLMHKFEWYRRSLMLFLLVALSLSVTTRITAQQMSRPESPQYAKLKKFELIGKASVSNLTLKRERATMVFTGDFYFASPIDGRITGAVFIGNGTFHAEPPDSQFDKENLKRLIDAEVVDSDFHTAVLRFTDDTADIIGKGMDANAAAPNEAHKLAAELEVRMLKETGANISARALVSMANNESPGFFFAQFDKGKRNRFSYMIDPQARIIGPIFGINGGEKVLLFYNPPNAYTNDLWISAYSEEDIKNKKIHYSDEYDLVSPDRYTMEEIDVREARRILKTKMRIDFTSLVNNLTTIPMSVNQGLSENENKRLTEAMRIISARQDGKDIPFIQEDFEAGLTFVLPRAVKKGEQFSVELTLEGDFISNQRTFENNYYPQFNDSWYPRHGYLRRAQYDLKFRHKKLDKVSSVGTLVGEAEWPDSKEDRLSQFKMDAPIPIATFTAGRFDRYSEKFPKTTGEMPIDFYSLSGSVGASNEKFIAAELSNVLAFLSVYYGPYPFKDFRGAASPFSADAFPSLVFIPVSKGAQEANRDFYSTVGRATSRQWWGGVVTPRSYRDRWLIDGFAEYSAMMYVGMRHNLKSERDFIKEARLAMEALASGDKGNLGRAAEIGPMILGSRLDSRMTKNVSRLLTTTKGALVLRMLHFLFLDISLKDQMHRPFSNMLTAFFKKYQGRAASTEDFIDIANEHFAQTALAKRFGLNNLDWFFKQWVYEAKYPSYRLEYGIEEGAGGQSTLTLSVAQENAGPDWFMPLPVSIKFADNTEAQIQVYAKGPQSPAIKVPLPKKVSSVELDPDCWILSLKTSTKKK
jgi:hypothetical protein